MTVLPTLLPARKWRKEKDRLEVGDIVLLSFSKTINDKCIHAIVTKVLPDDEGFGENSRSEIQEEKYLRI